MSIQPFPVYCIYTYMLYKRKELKSNRPSGPNKFVKAPTIHPTPCPVPQPFIQACCAHEFPNPLKIFTFEQPTPGSNMIFFCFAMNTAQHQVGPTRGQPAPSFPRGSPKGKNTKNNNPKTGTGLTIWGTAQGRVKPQP